MASRYAHAKQFKRHRRQLRLLRSRLGRLIRDIRRKIAGETELEAIQRSSRCCRTSIFRWTGR
jgi:transposase, IS5 family